MRYFKVKKGSEAWDKFHKLWTHRDKWLEHRKEIEEFLGMTIEEAGLRTDPNVLTIDNIPERWKTHFKKHSNRAKLNSKINKEWRKLCNRLGLESYSIMYLNFDLGLWSEIKTAYTMMFDNYYFAENENRPFKDIPVWAEEVTESNFLRIRADWLEKEKSA